MARIDELLDDWKKDHQHPANRALHLLGITLIGGSVALLPILPLSVPLGVLGWGAQLGGHYIEGKPPTFTKDPKYALVGAVWYWRQVTGFLRGKSPLI
jgi:hypothetical protein